MNRIYKSPEGERLVRERYLAFLKHWPVAHQQIGETQIGRTNPGAPASRSDATSKGIHEFRIPHPPTFSTAPGEAPVFSDDALRRLAMPVLTIVGARDVLLDSAETKSRLDLHPPKAEVVYLQEVGHFIPGQAGKVLAFLSQESSAF